MNKLELEMRRIKEDIETNQPLGFIEALSHKVSNIITCNLYRPTNKVKDLSVEINLMYSPSEDRVSRVVVEYFCRGKKHDVTTEIDVDDLGDIYSMDREYKEINEYRKVWDAIEDDIVLINLTESKRDKFSLN